MPPLNDNIREAALQQNFTILINNCCRELNNSTYYEGCPRYDEALAAWFTFTGHRLHLKFDFPADGVEVYVPLRYRSFTQLHRYDFPVAERRIADDVIREIGPERFLELAANHAAVQYPGISAGHVRARLLNSISNMAAFLAHFQKTGRHANKPVMSFLEAEQLLPEGHPTHPLTKSREGFTPEELLQYSPETGARFQLHYFLVHPDHVTEKSPDDTLPSDAILQQLQTETELQDILQQHKGWKAVPVHPREVGYLLENATVKQMQEQQLLVYLGAHGPAFAATSSVRTVYNETSRWMYKLSLHVKITSSERINHLHELYRGYNVSRLLALPWGQQLLKDHPAVHLISDPTFMAVSYEGKVIDGFSTSFRLNPFTGKDAARNAGLLASFCQDGILQEPSRLQAVIKAIAERTSRPQEEVAVTWFTKYLQLLLEPVVSIFSNYGMACECHQQNMLLELGADLYPAAVWLRDNQSFLFRKSVRTNIEALIPNIEEHGRLFVKDERLFELMAHYLVISNIIALINALGSIGAADEVQLLSIAWREFERLETQDNSGFVTYILRSRYWKEKANLLTAMANIDGSGSPASVIYVQFPNVLHYHFFSRQLISPEGKEVFYNRYFPKEDVVISLRPVDLDRDLDMLHEWFNREHAKKIWQMDWPLKQLETYYRTLLPGDMMYSYIGEANGEPTFNIEVYWAIRDMVGDYYDVVPTDYGTHQFIAPVDPKKKYASPSTQCMVDYVFAQPEVGKMVGEGSVDSLASMMNKAHVGFKIEKVIEMPHKKANLNFCYREWYWAKFPQNKDIKITPVAEVPVKSLENE